MFSGIVEEVGTIQKLVPLEQGLRLSIQAPLTCRDAELGESIAVCGVCLTVVAFDSDHFEVEAVAETLNRTCLGQLEVGSRVNLEKSVRLGGRLGGHLVTGHVDALATLSRIEPEGVSRRMTFELSPEWAPYFVPKGSVAVHGVSLTVADCAPPTGDLGGESPFWFQVALIPHTLEVTTLGQAQVGDRVNIETDLMARYAVRLLEVHRGTPA